MVATRERFRLDGKVAIIAGVGETNSRHIALALADPARTWRWWRGGR